MPLAIQPKLPASVIGNVADRQNAPTARVMMVARALMHHEKGKAYGKISAKALAVLTALLWRFHNAATASSATRCNDVARSRVAGSPFSRSGPGEARRQGGECGSGQIKPREPGRPQPDATTFCGSASFAISPGRRISRPTPPTAQGFMGKREPQKILKTDERSIHIELGCEGKF